MTWQPLQPATAHRNGVAVDFEPDTEMWRNDQYIVHRRTVEGHEGVEPMYHLSIRNADNSTRHDWRDFQRIKNQLAGPEYEGVELYPAESKKIDTANQYHLFCFPFPLGIGWKERMVTNRDVTTAQEPGANQRNNEPIDGPLNTLEEIQEWAKRSDARLQAAEETDDAADD